jgi:hypothetical protein
VPDAGRGDARTDRRPRRVEVGRSGIPLAPPVLNPPCASPTRPT